jgi:hypothetical protein
MRRAVCAGLLVAAAAVPAAGATSDVAALRICGTVAPFRAGLGYRYVILQPSEYRRIRAIKRRFPGVKVLAYKDMASTRQGARPADALPAGVDYAWANRRHREWFLKDRSGRRLAWSAWPDHWQMDVGNPSYQRTWEDNVARELRQRHWDGVFVDGIAQTMQHPGYLAGRVLAKYPGKDDYARATTSFLRRVGPDLQHQHLLVVGNVNDADGAQWEQWLGFLSGVSKEWWTNVGTGPRGFLTGSDWRFQTRLLEKAQAHGKIFVAITYGRAVDAAAMAYARASFLLFADGGRSAFVYSNGCSGEPAAAVWRADLGPPQGKAAVSGWVWRRKLRHGLVLVNTSPTAVVKVDLDATYLAGGRRVTSVRLRPHTAALLRTS